MSPYSHMTSKLMPSHMVSSKFTVTFLCGRWGWNKEEKIQSLPVEVSWTSKTVLRGHVL